MRTISPSQLGFGLAALVLTSSVFTSSCAANRGPSSESPASHVSGAPAALYPVPPSSPHGEVRVTTLGIATLQAGRDLLDDTHALHVRMIVTNDDDRTAWEVDTREQVAVLDRYGRSRPAFASCTSGRPPLVTIVPGASVAMDLYYPLPKAMQQVEPVPLYELLWHVHTAVGKTVTERTSFQGTWLEKASATAGHNWDWNLWHPGWYDPFWPEEAFSGSPLLAPAFYREPAVELLPKIAH
jgi:hypothetical protein